MYAHRCGYVHWNTAAVSPACHAAGEHRHAGELRVELLAALALTITLYRPSLVLMMTLHS